MSNPEELIQYASPATQRSTAALSAVQAILHIFALILGVALILAPFFEDGKRMNSIVLTFRIAVTFSALLVLVFRSSKIVLAGSIYVAVGGVSAGLIMLLDSATLGVFQLIYYSAWSFWGIFLLVGAIAGFYRIQRMYER